MAYAQSNQTPLGNGDAPGKNFKARTIANATSSNSSRKRYRPPTAYNSDWRPAPNRPTTSDIFTDQQYSGGIPTTPIETTTQPTDRKANGVQNPAVTYKNTAALVNDNQAPRTSGKNSSQAATRLDYNTGLRPSPQPRSRTKKRGVKKIAATAYKLAARTSLLSVYSWTGFLWLFVQIPLAILMIVCIGIVFSIELIVGDGITKNVFDAVMGAFGVDWDFTLAAFICYAVLVAFCYLQLAGIWLQCALTGMHPTSGQGGGLKTGALITVMVLYWVPILNMLPLAWLWVFTISLYPR